MLRRRFKGFTLIEMLLVLVIISVLIYASIGYVQQRALQLRYDRTSTQMQQILNAGLAYYVFNGTWPSQMSDLTTGTAVFLPTGMKNPWGDDYHLASTAELLYVYSRVNFISARGAFAAVNVIAGTLPLAYTSNDNGGAPPSPGSPCTATDTSCSVVGSVNIPGLNLNNASAVNFAGMYHHGACVPVPQCPVDPRTATTMIPQIMVAPVQVSGTNDGGTPPGVPNPNVYPISSFTAYIKGPAATPAQCESGAWARPCPVNPNVTQYWRVCIKIVTEKGEITAATSPDWGKNQSLLAITRCAISGEPSGHDFTVFTD